MLSTTTISTRTVSTATLLKANNVSKRYGVTQALENAGFELRPGEVHALVGANGSGKSTLAKIIAGLVRPDAGELELLGHHGGFRTPLAARAAGIATVYQELSLAPDLSVETNIWLGHEITGALGRVDAKATRARTLALIHLLEGVVSPKFQPDTVVAELSPDERQLVEILKAMSLEPRVLVLDEATASLDARQVERVFMLVRQRKAQGCGIVIITHRMEELFAVADRATVLRNGMVVGKLEMCQTSREQIVELMTGEAQHARERSVRGSSTGKTLVQLELRHSGKLRDITLELHAGEIVGLGGLQGQGQSELLLTLFGAIPLETGTLTLEGQTRRFRHPAEAMRARLAYVPGDRNREGLLGGRPIMENLMLPNWNAYRNLGFLDLNRATRIATEVGSRLRLKAASLGAPIGSLSGGNAQKVVLGKWLVRNPRVLLLDDPTKGIDVNAKSEFYGLLEELRTQGLAVLFYSSDDDELVTYCDRVLVMFEGRVVRTLEGDGLRRANLIRASIGEK
jgi:ribose transport system ATP-binding protein